MCQSSIKIQKSLLARTPLLYIYHHYWKAQTIDMFFFYPISKAVFKVYNINYVKFSFDNCNKQNINNRNFNNFSQMIKFSTRKTKTQFESKLEKQTLSNIPQINRNQNAESRAILSGSVCMYGLSDSPLLVLEVCWLFLLQTIFLFFFMFVQDQKFWRGLG